MAIKTMRAVAGSMLAFALAFGASAVAAADPQPVPASNIDVQKQDASITIHKMLNPDQTKTATGEEDPDAAGTPLQGVTFKITKLNLGLDSNADLERAAQLTPEAAGGLKTDTTFQVTTPEAGVVTQTVPVGVYLVEELTPAAEATLMAGGERINPKDLVPAKPFVVRVPMRNVAGNAWNYDIHVYPKNSTDALIKEVKDAGKNGGGIIAYTIKVAAPLVQGEAYRTKFVVKDNYDAAKLENLTVTSVKVGDQLVDPVNYDIADNDGELTVTFKTGAEGRLVYDIPNNSEVAVTVDARIKSTAQGEIKNKAFRIDRDSTMESDSTKPTNEVNTYVGAVKVVKKGLGGEALEGAEFELYRCVPKAGDKWELKGEAIQTLTTIKDGTATTKPLHVTDFEDNSTTVADENQNYCLKETKAPAGYVTPKDDAAITHFTLTRENLGAPGYTTIKMLPEITNEPSDTPDLPLTGGQGVALLVLLGAGVGGAAVYSARRNSTKA